MLIHPWDRATEDEWHGVLRRHDFGQLVVARQDGFPLVVPSHFVYDGGDQVWLHLARPNPVWRALQADPRVVLALSTDYSYIEAAWNADAGVPPEHGVPTSYYTAVQLRCHAEVVDDEAGKLEILRRQLRRLEPEDSTRVPPSTDVESDRRLLPGIRGLRLTIVEVLAKMKYGGNKDVEQRTRIAEALAQRGGPLDAAAREQLLRRAGAPEA
jgi:transcriptional regulator